MKTMFRLMVLGFASVLVLPALAQQDKKKKIEKKEQIIISKSGDKEEKMTIVVDGDHVTVNGKPLEQFEKENGELKVIRRKSLKDGDEDVEVFVNPDGKASPRISIPRMPRGARSPMYRYYNNFGNGEAAARAFLGVVSKDNDKGAEITGVNENTPASKAGLQKGDIITRVGDKEVKDPSSLLEAVRANKPNDEVEVSYLRDGKQKKSKVKLGETKEVFNEFKFEMPEMPAMPKMDFHFDDNWADEFKGNMDEFKREFRLNEGDGPMTWNMQPRPRLGAKISDLEEGDGAKVLEVETEMAGAKAGLQKDDVITEIDGKAIRNTDDAREALKELKDKNAYQVKIKRGNDTKTLDVKIPKKIKTANL